MKTHAILALGTFFMLFFAPNLTAQSYDSFDLSTYYTPDIARNKLDLKFGSNGLYNNDEVSSSTRSSFNGNFEAVLNHFLHTRKRYSLYGAALKADGYFSK